MDSWKCILTIEDNEWVLQAIKLAYTINESSCCGICFVAFCLVKRIPVNWHRVQASNPNNKKFLIVNEQTQNVCKKLGSKQKLSTANGDSSKREFHRV